jgi:ABC-2 type transport system ATP-binding protein
MELAERLRLEPSVPARKMSRGMRQKLGLVLALAHDPELVIMDEPTSGLDPLMREELAAILRECVARGHTVFFSSHTLSEVEQLCDRVAIVRQGRIVADETLASLRSRAQRTVTLVFENVQAARVAEAPGFLSVHHRVGDAWRCGLKGSAKELIQWAACQRIDDVTIGQPDLNSLFQQFYQSSEEPP